MQHFLHLPIDATTCQDAATALATLLQQDGVTLDPVTDQLLSSARLQVGFTPPAAPADPCQPDAQGGYLGADNQMIRVTITQFESQKRAGVLAWGWNNASFLYRATVVSPQTLSLSPMPLDAEHAPQQGQAVEILLTEADLGDGDLIAAPSGPIVVLTQAYDPDTNLLTLPAGFTLPATKYPLFVRLWQALVPFTPGTPVALDTSSGLTVAIDMTALPSHVAARPFWHFAVRPATPVLVYPRRYLEAPQPPAGPRQWLCDLAVLQGSGKDFSILDDCRVHFGRGTACCDTVLGPEDVAAKGGLQAVLDAMAGGVPAMLSLRPGIYTLPAPLALTAKHGRLTLQGCGPGVVLRADPKALSGFTKGLIVAQQAAGLAFRRLLLEIPVAPAPSEPIMLMIGLFATDCTELCVEDCQFVFAPPRGSAGAGAAIAIAGVCQATTIRHSTFANISWTGTQIRSLFGILLTGATTAAKCDNVEIDSNLFEALGMAVAGSFNLGTLGLLRCCNNKIRQCHEGFMILSAGGSLANALAGAAPALQATSAPQAALADLRPETLAVRARAAQTAVATAGATLARLPTADTPAATPAAAPVPAAGMKPLLDALEQDLAAIGLPDNMLSPALHIRDNDITIAPASTFDGLSVTLTGRQPAQVLLGGNRVVTPGGGVAAATLTLYPGNAVVTGNLFVQGGTKAETTVPCVTVHVYGGGFEVMANVIQGGAAIQPARPTPLPATGAWEFLNTVA
jgi:hypothetical protein